MYDTVYAIARAMDTHIRMYGPRASFRGQNLKQVLYNNVSFQGLTGEVSFFSGLQGFETYYAGGRRTGAYYQVVNYHTCSAAGTTYPCRRTIGTLHSEQGYKACTTAQYADCDQIAYGTADNTKPLDWPLPVVAQLPTALAAVLWVLAVVILLLVIGFAAMVFLYQKTEVIKAGQPTMLYFILFGGLIGGFRIIVSTLHVSDATCSASLWLSHLSYGVVFGTLIIKTWRVHRLVNSGFKRVKITSSYINNVVIGSIFAMCMYLIVLQFVSRPHLHYVASYSGNKTTLSGKCMLEETALSTALIVVEGLTVLIGVVLCWLTRGVPDAVNESSHIATGE